MIDQKKPYSEMLLIIVVMLASFFIIPKAFGLISLLPIIYFVVESRMRKRTLNEIGFKHKKIYNNFKRVWLPFLLVAFGMQFIYFLMFTNFSPELIEHVKERTSFIKVFDGKIVATLFVLALGEEMVFRGIIQKRLQWKYKPIISIVITSAVFSILHLSDGTPLVVIADLSTVLIDSLFFGYLFYKTNNLYIAWFAHAIANTTAAFLLINFV